MMLESISWKQFFIFLVSAVTVYYAWVGYFLVKQWLKQARHRQVPGKRTWQIKEAVAEAEESASPLPDGTADKDSLAMDTEVTPEEVEAMEDLEQLSGAIERIILAGQVGPDRAALLADFSAAIRQYPRMDRPAFRRAINNVIIRRSREYCQITITEQEAEDLWHTTEG